MLNLDAIIDDRKTGVLCETREQVQALIDAVKQQRPDITVGDWTHSLFANEVYFLNYAGCHTLQHGRVQGITAIGLNYLQFEELIMDDLPEIEANQTGILSLLGL